MTTTMYSRRTSRGAVVAAVPTGDHGAWALVSLLLSIFGTDAAPRLRAEAAGDEADR